MFQNVIYELRVIFVCNAGLGTFVTYLTILFLALSILFGIRFKLL